MADHDDNSSPAESPGAESPEVDDSLSDSSEQRRSSHPGPQRDDEYADHAVHGLPKRAVTAPPEEKKVVITSRQVDTLKLKHQDFPRLAERVAAERGEHARDAEEWVEPPRPRKQGDDESSTAWVDDPPSFDPDALPRSQPSKPERRKTEEPLPPRSRTGLVFALLLLAAASGFAFLVVTGKIDLPEMTAGVEPSAAPLPKPTPAPTPSVPPAASATAPAPTLPAMSAPAKGSAAPSASASGKSRGKRPVRPPPVAPPPVAPPPVAPPPVAPKPSAAPKSENDLFER